MNEDAECSHIYSYLSIKLSLARILKDMLPFVEIFLLLRKYQILKGIMGKGRAPEVCRL